jgi:hypothetical protein
MSEYTEAMDAYTVLMQEAKARLLAMDTALEGKTGLPEVAVREYCFLQLRMLCELIALGCLTAQGDLQTGKLKKSYKADQIICRLEVLHPDFYPYAATRTEAGIELRKDGFTKEELMKLYWKCGDVLHRGTVETLWSRKSGDVGIEEIRTWKQKIEALLSYHTILMADGVTAATFRLWEEDEWMPSSTDD